MGFLFDNLTPTPGPSSGDSNCSAHFKALSFGPPLVLTTHPDLTVLFWATKPFHFCTKPYKSCRREGAYIYKYQFIDIKGAITSWPKVIAAMFLCAICLFQSLLKKQPLTNSHINPSARQTLPNLLLLEAIAVVDLNPRPSSSRKLLCIRNTCKSLVDCAQKCWEQQTFSSDQ